MNIQLPVVAGGVSTVIFAASALPMLVKAGRTKDLGSYSLSNIILSNVGNAVHSIYVFHLPAGPVWVLHSFYLTSTALMLVWYVRFALRRSPRTSPGEVDSEAGSAEPSPARGPCAELPIPPRRNALGASVEVAGPVPCVGSARGISAEEEP